VTVGGEPLDLAGSAVEAEGQRVTVQRRDLREVYDATATQVKQSFHFTRLPRRGDLDLVLATATDLRMAASGDGIVFRHERGTVGYCDLLIVDAAGKQLRLPITSNGADIHLTVPAEFVAEAALPLVVDPVISSTTVAFMQDLRMQPDVAWNETAQEHLVVWQQPFSSTDWDVLAIRCDAFMAPLGAAMWIDMTASNWSGPRVACKNLEGMFLVVAQVNQGGGAPHSIRGRRYEDIAGQRVLWSQFDIQNPMLPAHLPGSSFSPDVGADPWPAGEAYFTVVWEYHPAGGNGDVVFRQLRADGSFATGSIGALNVGPYDDRAPSISKSPGEGRYGIVWTQYGPWGSDGNIVGAVINYDGLSIVAPFYVDTSANDDTRPRISTPARLSPGRRTFLVTWQRNNDPFGNYGRLHAAGITDDPNAVLINRWDLSALLGIPLTTMASEPVVDSDGLRFVVAHSEVAAAAPGTGRSDTFASTLALDGTQLLVHEGRAVLQNSGPQTAAPAIASRYGGGLADSRSYGIVCGSNAISVLGWLYNGHQPGAFWNPRAGGCGGLTLSYGGYPVFGHAVDLAVGGADPFRTILLGFPLPMTPMSVCANCTIGVQQAVTVPSPYHWDLPYVPSLVGLTLSAQGLSAGGAGSCLGSLRLSGAVDFTVR
jgi:hypothetical protein